MYRGFFPTSILVILGLDDMKQRECETVTVVNVAGQKLLTHTFMCVKYSHTDNKPPEPLNTAFNLVSRVCV